MSDTPAPGTPSPAAQGTPPPPALPVTFRPSLVRIILITAGVAILVLLTVISFVLPQLSPGERSSFIFTGALCLAGLALLGRPKIVADDTGLTVVNVASSRRLEWAQILQVNLRPGDPWVFLDLSDGTSLAAMGIQPGVSRERAITDARALRALVQTHGTAARG
ncbi:PH domain-containing protein [Streptomyces uncialis]|uniref:Membrane protein n=1 Tax=Streptomyces uncialis TaxID=1048205 RepID=A0A1Q4V3L5_9ACTN|nr:PH domain-containing protein [Streptomyces uncialis]MCX4662601.1 PH domain-containing protein [Streptomyces uncialis]OKH92445.1 membrane protein [Streptomyces uncialis]WST71518.1 PH domain-containing protein [Streptomyces uncialis]WTE09821.1 PH domain-containing protein [Streptomyces uncialis]